MDEKMIRPIPKYMVEKIRKLDKKECPTQRGRERYYSYFTRYGKELCLVTVAVKSRGMKKWHCKQVVVHGIDSDRCYLKDICYYTIAGYHVGWYREGLSSYCQYWEDGEWGWYDDKGFHIVCPIINKKYVKTIKEFRYSAVDKFRGRNAMKYLRLYRQYPIGEMFVKLNLSHYATSVQILKKATVDKKFCKWIVQNQNELALKDPIIPDIMRAYKEGKSIQEVMKAKENELIFHNMGKEICNAFNNDIDRFFVYLEKQKIEHNLYRDYYVACKGLDLDMSVEKNLTPHDFMKWHNIRIDEWHTKQTLLETEKRKKYLTQFIEIAKKYLPLQRQMKEDWICVIAMRPEDLIREGEFLHHCVGRMNYDQKFAREESLIFFIRNKNEPNKPFVTLEYSIEQKKVLQCYADHDSKPSEEVLNYVNKIWLPYANRKIRKIA